MTKKSLFIALIAVFCLVLPAQAQLIQKVKLMTPHYYPGVVYFTDGHSEAFDEVELPQVTRRNLDVKKSLSDKKRTTIDAKKIAFIQFWHKDFPEKVHTLYYVYAKSEMMQSPDQWGFPIAESSWGVLYQCEANYEMNKKTGDLNIIKFVGGSSPDTPTLFYVKRNGDEKARLLVFDEFRFASKKKTAELFKENPAIYNGIKSGELRPADLPYIIEAMGATQEDLNQEKEEEDGK